MSKEIKKWNKKTKIPKKVIKGISSKNQKLKKREFLAKIKNGEKVENNCLRENWKKESLLLKHNSLGNKMIVCLGKKDD